MQKQLNIALRGVTALLMHRNPGERASGGGTRTPPNAKTDQWWEDRYKAMWQQAAYWDATVGFHFPVLNIEAAIVQGSKALRLAPKFKVGFRIREDLVPLIVYDSTADEKGRNLNGKLTDWYQRYQLQRAVLSPKTGTHDLVTPAFPHWGLRFGIIYETDILDEKQIKNALEKTGQFVGLGAWRPRHGLFRLEGFAPCV